MSDKPLVSVIIPCFNEEKDIEQNIRGMVHQDYTGDMEIIVVDDGSTDQTFSVASQYKKKSRLLKNRKLRILPMAVLRNREICQNRPCSSPEKADYPDVQTTG